MADRDPKEDLAQAFDLLKVFGANLTLALERINELKQANIAQMHLIVALIATYSRGQPLTLVTLANNIRSMQSLLEESDNTVLARKELDDVVQVLEGAIGQSNTPGEGADLEVRLVALLKDWAGGTKH